MKVINYPTRAYFNAIKYPIYISTMMYISVFYCRNYVFLDSNFFLRLMELILTGAVTYIGIFYLWKGRQLLDTVGFIKKLLKAD